MDMTICYISEKPQEGLYKEGFKKYDILRYHYYIYCHCLTTVHDLLFKLIQNLYDFKINKRMISWDTLLTELTRVGALDIISEIEDFYSKIKPHEQKRNSASHEGFLSHKTLDYFYLIQIWTNVQQNQSGELSHPELFEGMPEKIDFLDVKQDSFVSELQETMNLAKEHVIRLMTLLLPQLVARIDTSFIKKHELHLASLNKDCLNKYILAMSLFDTNNTAETVISPKKD